MFPLQGPNARVFKKSSLGQAGELSSAGLSVTSDSRLNQTNHKHTNDSTRPMIIQLGGKMLRTALAYVLHLARIIWV